jgi:hypothetical protein
MPDNCNSGAVLPFSPDNSVFVDQQGKPSLPGNTINVNIPHLHARCQPPSCLFRTNFPPVSVISQMLTGLLLGDPFGPVNGP